MSKSFCKLLYKYITTTDFIKKSYFLGIVYYKKNLKDSSSEIRIFGLPFWKKKFRRGKERFYLLGLLYWRRSSKKKLYNTILEYVEPKYSNIYINFNCSGETYLFLSYIKPSKDSIFIATKKYHKDLCRMMHPEIDCIYLPDIVYLRSLDNNNIYKEEYKGKTFYNILPFNYFVRFEDNLRKGKEVHYCEEICKTIGIEYTKEAKKPIISEETKQNTLMKVKRIGLNLDNFVFLCPESQSNENPKDSFWIDLTDTLYSKGYDIFINTISLKPEYGTGKTCFLTFDEAYYLASLSKKIIGLRSGFIEMLTSNNVPIICYYTDFKNRGLLKSINAERVLKGFSLKKLPNVKPDNIFEFDIKNYTKGEQLDGKSFCYNAGV